MTCVIPVLKGIGLGLVSGVALFALIALPAYRRPWKIAGFHNIRMFKLALAMSWAGFWISFFAVLSGVCIDFSHSVLFWLAFLWFAVPPLLGTVWVLYWDIPFFRKKTGRRKVDETIARYRLEGETVRAGLPRIVDKDGTRYVVAAYTRGAEVESFIAINEATAQVVREPHQMERLARCARLGVEMAGFPSLYRRMNDYFQTRKALKAWPGAMRRFDRVMKVFQQHPEVREDIQALRQGWEIWKVYAEKLMAMWEQEGAWASEHGWEQMKEVPCDALESLDEQLRTPYLFLREHLEEMLGALESAYHLGEVLNTLEISDGQRERVQSYLGLMYLMESSIRLLASWPSERPLQRFMWTDDERRRWRERLRMVEEQEKKE